MDTIVNFLTATLAASATDSDTSLTVTAGHGARFGSSFPYDVVVFDPTYANAALAYWAGKADVVRVTARSGDVLTVTRNRQGVTPVALGSGWVVIQASTSDLLSQVVPNSLLTTRGDIITRGASGPQRLALGAEGLVTMSDGTDLVFAGIGGGAAWSADITNWDRLEVPGLLTSANRALTAGRLYATRFFVTQPCTLSKVLANGSEPSGESWRFPPRLT